MKRTRIQRIQRILSGGDNRSPSEASASIRVKSVFDKKLRGETNTDCRRMKRILSDGGNVFQTDELYDGVILIHRHPATLLFLFFYR